jgi:hypothetical protein
VPFRGERFISPIRSAPQLNSPAKCQWWTVECKIIIIVVGVRSGHFQIVTMSSALWSFMRLLAFV